MLDERTHKAEPLISTALKQYQGPALLSYNNAVFTEKDFYNLSRLGDSLKIQDGLTTGKFGRGFNSVSQISHRADHHILLTLQVYNWTDSPSIVSRKHLLILDPHEEWSTGGPVYDFVENSSNPAIQNHIEAFQTVLEHPDKPLEGTIIRIPLRTEVQAKKSEISSRKTTVLELRKVLQQFAVEFGDNGLLFLRNIEKIGIESSAGISIEIEIVNREKIRS
jgi:sacsin